MKQLIVISGTMGVGKTTVCQTLNRSLEGSAWLDGDWCWTMNPWVVNDETRKMVEDHIVYMLRNFLQCSTFDTVLFSWVLHREEILEQLLTRLNDLDFTLTKISLTCTQQELRRRMEQGGRTEEQITASIDRLKLYEERTNEHLIDTSELTIDDTVDQIMEIYSGKQKPNTRISDAPMEVTCSSIGVYGHALRRGDVYQVRKEQNGKYRIMGQHGKAIWVDKHYFQTGRVELPMLESWVFDDNPDEMNFVELTLTFKDGSRRWCLATTPQKLADHYREGLWASVGIYDPHLIIMETLNPDMIQKMLIHLENRNELMQATIPLSGPNT